MGDLAAVFTVVHEEHLELVNVGNDDLAEAVGEDVAGLLVGPVSDGRHGYGTLEPALHASVNSLRLPP